jgi:hypothetical protein
MHPETQKDQETYLFETMTPEEFTNFVSDSEYTETKASEAVMYILSKINKPTHTTKLLQILYLADREDWGRLIYDIPIATSNGMSFLKTSKFLTQAIPGKLDWNALIPVNKESIATLPTQPHFKRISKHNTNNLDKALILYASKTIEELSNYTKTLPEWSEPTPPSMEKILTFIEYQTALGHNQETLRAILENAESLASINAILKNPDER